MKADALAATIAVDAMGGDGGTRVTLSATAEALGRFPGLKVVLVGDKKQIEAQLSQQEGVAGAQEAQDKRLEICHTAVGAVDRSGPGKVLWMLREGRRGRPCAMYRALELHRQGQVQAVVSGGDTGALVMLSRHLLKTINGIRKPALVARLPVAAGMGLLLDAGANPESDAELLFQFAVMGAALGEGLSGRKPRMGLLNIGEESYKGTAEVQAAAEMMRGCPGLQFAGFIEANKLFRGEADVVVCNGFAGNVTIKTSEGAAEAIQELLREKLDEQQSAQQKELRKEQGTATLSARIDPARFNGASLLGLQGSVIKSHGNASQAGFVSAIRQAMEEVERDVPRLISHKVAAMLNH